ERDVVVPVAADREAVLAQRLGRGDHRRAQRGEHERARDAVADGAFDQRQEEQLPNRTGPFEAVDQHERRDGGEVEGDGREPERLLTLRPPRPPREREQDERADAEDRRSRPRPGLVPAGVVLADRDLDDGEADGRQADPRDPALEVALALQVEAHERLRKALSACSRSSGSSLSAYDLASSTSPTPLPTATSALRRR